MEKQKLEPGMVYHICDVCETWVPANLFRCNNCSAVIPVGAEEYVAEPESAAEPEAMEESGSGLTMYCTVCDRQWSAGHTQCPTCGEILQPFYQEDDSISRDEPILEDEEEELEKTILPNQIYDEEQIDEKQELGEKPQFQYMAYRYDASGKKVASREVRLTEEETFLGRYLFLREGLFFPKEMDKSEKRKLDAQYQSISRKNILLRQRDGHLFAELASNNGKIAAPVRINGVKLGEKEQKELKPGDRIDFGSKNIQGRIEVEVYGTGFQIDNAKDNGINFTNNQIIRMFQQLLQSGEENRRRLDEMQKEIVETKKHAQSTSSKMEEVVSSVDRLTLEILTRREGERENDYIERISSLVPDIPDENDQREFIHKFLRIEYNGEEKDCYDQVKEIKNLQMSMYLYHAAACEKLCDMLYEKRLENYDAPLSFIGRAIEEFICTELYQIIIRSQKRDFQQYVIAKKGKPNSPTQGMIVRYFGGAEDDDERQKKSRRVDRALQYMGYAEAELEEQGAILMKASDDLMVATMYRNDSSHAAASAKLGGRKNASYIASSEKGITKIQSHDDYYNKKQEIFESGALKHIHEYYVRATRQR